MWKDCSRVQCSTIEDRSTAQQEGLAQCMLWWWRNLLQAIYLLLFCFIAFHRLLASRINILYWQVLRHLDSATRSSVPWFIHVLEASFFGAANIKDSGVVGLHNGTSPHDRFPVDLGSPATMTNVTASRVLFHNCTTPHKGFLAVLVPNGTSPHDRFPVDLGSPATMTNVTASGVLFHNCTTPHDCFCVDPNMSSCTEMTTGTQVEWVECISE